MPLSHIETIRGDMKMREKPTDTITEQENETNILDLVMTTKEASEKYEVADCTFRTWIKEGHFTDSEIKKSGNTWLIKKQAIEALLKSKNMLGKTFKLDGDSVHVEHLGYKTKDLQIWFENQAVKDIIEQMPHQELVSQMFEVFKAETKMNYKNVLIYENKKESDNWFFRKDKVWALTLKGVLDTVRQSMQLKDVDTDKLDAYMVQNGMTV